MLVLLRGAGDIASGIAVRLYQAGFHIVMLDLPNPTSIRRSVCFSEALRLGTHTIEGITAQRCGNIQEISNTIQSGAIAVYADPEGSCIANIRPDVVVDAILAKRNIGTTKDIAPIVVGVGPGFCAPIDCHAAVETMRGHYLGRVYYDGAPIPNTAVPGLIGGFTGERVLRAPADGILFSEHNLGDVVEQGEVIAKVDGIPLQATLNGVLRGLIQNGAEVYKGMKVGDIDPRNCSEYISTVSDKARAVGGGVLEAILHCQAFAIKNRQ